MKKGKEKREEWEKEGIGEPQEDLLTQTRRHGPSLVLQIIFWFQASQFCGHSPITLPSPPLTIVTPDPAALGSLPLNPP